MKNYVFPISFLFSLLFSLGSCTKEEETPLNPDIPVLQVDISPNPTNGPIDISFNAVYQNIGRQTGNYKKSCFRVNNFL